MISSSFADIFYNNCFKNGILPINLKQDKVDYLMSEAENKNILFVDLEDQVIIDEAEKKIYFEIDSFRKKCLLEGLDDIALTLKKINKIDSFEKNLNNNLPWII